jgi:hypothetical protein
MPESLSELLDEVGKKSVQEPASEFNEKDYLDSMPRKADIMLLAAFFGLYSSLELPPADIDDYNLDGNQYEFNVDITREIEVLRNLLLALWISDKEKIIENPIEYRGEFYSFLERILDPSFLKGVVLPFYLEKAEKVEGGDSFITALERSRYVKWEMSFFAPERIALEYQRKKGEFIAHIENQVSKFVDLED